jgi:hypothetical protein
MYCSFGTTTKTGVPLAFSRSFGVDPELETRLGRNTLFIRVNVRFGGL